MKTLNEGASGRPRLTCRVVQGWVSIIGDGTEPRGAAWGARHVAACDGCRAFFHVGEALESSLRRSAPAERKAAPAGLEEQIIAALRRSERPAPRTRPIVGGGAFVLMGAAACAALALFVVLKNGRAPEASGVSAPTTVAAGEGSGGALVIVAGEVDSVWSKLQPDTAELLEAAPLQREVDAFYSDARSALGFLALNFLPSSVAATVKGG